MEQFLDKVAAVNDVINTFVWVKIGIIILLGVGIVTTVCTKFFQLSHLGLWWKNTIGSLFRKQCGKRKHSDPERACTHSTAQALCNSRGSSRKRAYLRILRARSRQGDLRRSVDESVYRGLYRCF